jgi:hypothetical protein
MLTLLQSACPEFHSPAWRRTNQAVHLTLENRRGPGVGQRALADNLAGGIQDADMMRPVTGIEAEGEPAGGNRSGLVAPRRGGGG